MTITDNPNAAYRDGARETELRELGIDTPVVHDGRGYVTITIPARTLDLIIAGDLIDRSDLHGSCGDYFDEDVEAARAEGWEQGRKEALRAIQALAS